MAAAESNNSVSWLGVSAIIVFYLVILVIGILAGWFKTRKNSRHSVQDAGAHELAIVAGRDIGIFVGCFTMIGIFLTCRSNFDQLCLSSAIYEILLSLTFFLLPIILKPCEQLFFDIPNLFTF